MTSQSLDELTEEELLAAAAAAVHYNGKISVYSSFTACINSKQELKIDLIIFLYLMHSLFIPLCTEIS